MKNLCSLLILLSISIGVLDAAHTIFKVPNSSSTIVVMQGDITKVQAECIVNAANEMLLGGAGVCGAIFKAAGWEKLQEACDQYPLHKGVRCPAGSARITDSFNLRSHGVKHIIHAVGPDCRVVKDTREQDRLLAGAYDASLLYVTVGAAKSIAFPFISSAIFAFPKERAARIAMQSVLKYFEQHPKTSLSVVYFVLFSQEDYDLFCKIGQQILSCDNHAVTIPQEHKKSYYQKIIEYLKRYFE